MTDEGKYIYCIIEENKEKRFGSIGINGREVILLHYKDISAVVSNTPIIDFDRFDNKKELLKYAAVHQKVNEEIMKKYDVVPMAFGTIAPNAREAGSILERAYLQFKIALEELAGKTEFAIQVWWDEKRIINELVGANLEIRRLKHEMILKSGFFKLPMKLKLGRLIHKELEIQKKIYIKGIQKFLDEIAHNRTLNKFIDKEMLANFSFLISKNKESELDKKMAELGKKYEGKLRFKYIGPMPPYSFVKINLSLNNFGMIDGARQVLGLDEEAALKDIKNAYYKLAHKHHPDKNIEGPEKAEKQMKRITAANRILQKYCQSCNMLLPADEQKEKKIKDQKYSFRKEDIKNSLLIN